MNIGVIAILVAVIIFALFLSKGAIEGYSSRSATIKSYRSIPTYEPGWLYDYWFYYSPYRFRMGYKHWPHYGLFPHVYKPRPYIYYW